MNDELNKVEDVKTALMYEGEDEEKYMEQYEENTKFFAGQLPAIVQEFQKDATNVAH